MGTMQPVTMSLIWRVQLICSLLSHFYIGCPNLCVWCMYSFRDQLYVTQRLHFLWWPYALVIKQYIDSNILLIDKEHWGIGENVTRVRVYRYFIYRVSEKPCFKFYNSVYFEIHLCLSYYRYFSCSGKKYNNQIVNFITLYKAWRPNFTALVLKSVTQRHIIWIHFCCAQDGSSCKLATNWDPSIPVWKLDATLDVNIDITVHHRPNKTEW